MTGDFDMQFLFPRSSIIIPRMYERKRKSNDRIRNSILYRKKNPPLKPLKNLKKSVKRKKKSISKRNTIPIICFRQDETKRRAKARSSLSPPSPLAGNGDDERGGRGARG